MPQQSMPAPPTKKSFSVLRVCVLLMFAVLGLVVLLAVLPDESSQTSSQSGSASDGSSPPVAGESGGTLRACFENGSHDALTRRLSMRRIMQMRTIASL